MNTRPVRFAPCAAGARPRTSRRACGSPKPGTGLAPVDVVAMRRLLVARDAVAVGAQPRAAACSVTMSRATSREGTDSASDRRSATDSRPATAPARARDRTMRTSGPDSTWPKPSSEADALQLGELGGRVVARSSAGWRATGRRYCPMVTIWHPTRAKIAKRLHQLRPTLRRGRPSARTWSGSAVRTQRERSSSCERAIVPSARPRQCGTSAGRSRCCG